MGSKSTLRRFVCRLKLPVLIFVTFVYVSSSVNVSPSPKSIEPVMDSAVHVVLMTYNNTAGNERHEITCSQVQELLSNKFGELRIHLVWNSAPLASPCAQFVHDRFEVHPFPVNTLMNRWYLLGHLNRRERQRSGSQFLLLDDDLMITPGLFSVLLRATKCTAPTIAGPFTRRYDISPDGRPTYVMKEILTEERGVEYHHILPRVMMLNSAAVDTLDKYFKNPLLTQIVDRTTTEDLLVSLVMNLEGGRLIRTVPCVSSIKDFFNICKSIRSRGLASRRDWSKTRNQALQELHRALGSFKLSSYREVYRLASEYCKPSYSRFLDRDHGCK